MASLYIKDSETAELATELAARLGVTKTEVVRDSLRKRKAELTPLVSVPSMRERLDAWRRDHPLGEPTGLKADKAFFDELWGEEPD
ncbi:type II toxin-antitoxin system VapB family antitoxin [Sphingomonas albertensis]|uniref:Type II toxin-antitoxin system VapB family antitoxin n=1 Tax=Sphingomonas albertensis TaxID=2762591 RepID=A0ABR7APE7_9SPHN|nr:type II toxin-antitoxin system VapB family antitoxin [Sphingomonas albertensis]MBC3942339.1 type II toxin-antitoxin system VapB family antitoxin [Sphingomonas albertensis]